MPPHVSIRTRFASALVALGAVLTSGCESAIFRIANHGLEAPEATVRYSEDPDLALDIYQAVGASAAAPTVVFFYGGGWQRGERAQYQFVGRRLARHGVLVIVADYRTWPAAGFPAFVHDAARAVQWTQANVGSHGGDPQQIFLAGHSAGAQIAALLAADPRYLRDVGLEPSALAGVVGLSGPYDFVISGRYRPVFGPPSQWPQAQAINFVDGNEPPFLLIHGSDDGVVAPRNSEQLARKLRTSGVPARVVLIEDAGHSAPLMGLYDPDRSPLVVPAILDFVGPAAGNESPAIETDPASSISRPSPAPG
ncbi:MAG: alpha/beta hydrolase [Pseudomonadota bacterium]|nr:alpha/beta hydrolase [Pseudomonadota bacterium]